jgi:hypothetical protein
LLQVLDPAENTFEQKGDLRLQDLETGQVIRIDGITATDHFKKGLEKHTDQLKRFCKELHIDYEMITTDEPFQKALLRVLEKRRRML